MKSKPKILIVDDRPENLVALEVVLRDLNITIIKALNGNDALRETLHHDFALALLDIQMPEMDGYELAGILREEEKTAHLPFIFISAVYTDNLNVFKGYEKGAFSFITKPFHPDILINKVKFFIEKHEQQAALEELNDKLEAQNRDLEFSNKELEAFTYSVSHDLRAPLRAVSSYTSILKEEYQQVLDSEGNRLLNAVDTNALKMARLIDSLLSLSRLGRTSLRKSMVDMNLLVSEILSDLREQGIYNATTKIEVKPLPPVTGDLQLLQQVFSNLLSNAIKYSSQKAEPYIEVGCSNEGEKEITYYVKDNGAGFDMRFSEKLFGVFQRLHGNDEFEGIGIGLAIVKRIVNRHGGKVWAIAEVDKGAQFYITLPL